MGSTLLSGIESHGATIVVGALSAIAASLIYGVYQRRAHRRVLLQELREQIERFAAAPVTLSESSVFHRHTIHVHAVPLLLTGHVLDDVKDRELIRWLSIWQSVESQHNDAVRLAHRAAVARGMGSFHRQQIFAMIDEHHRQLLEVRERIRRLLFEPLVHRRVPRDLKDEYLDWGVPSGFLGSVLSRRERWSTWRLRRRSASQWAERALEAIGNADAARAATKERYSEDVEAENRNRRMVINLFDDRIIPALESLKEPLLRHRRSMRVHLRTEHAFDPTSPDRLGPGIASFTTIVVNITNMFDTSNVSFAITAKSTPTGVHVWLAHYQPPSLTARRGWRRELCASLADLTPDLVIAAVLERYETLLSLPRHRYSM